jgi:hypothetical protein
MRRLLLPVILLVGGCATEESLRATVGNASNFQLCRAIMLAPQNVANIARGEAASRNLDCAPYAGLIMQNQQASDAATSQAIQNLLRPAPPPQIQLPQQTNCTSYRIGNTVQTNCR